MSNRRKKTFTDDDLARTKREIPDGLNGYGFDSMYSFSVGDLQALVARLEAAEKVVRGHIKLESDKISYDIFVGLLNDWRKASGNK
jgi:hypothetical protein